RPVQARDWHPEMQIGDDMKRLHCRARPQRAICAITSYHYAYSPKQAKATGRGRRTCMPLSIILGRERASPSHLGLASRALGIGPAQHCETCMPGGLTK